MDASEVSEIEDAVDHDNGTGTPPVSHLLFVECKRLFPKYFYMSNNL